MTREISIGWTEPITDRTEQDVEQGTAKGFANTEDLTRLDGNCALLGELLGVALVAGRVWQQSDFPTEAELRRIQSSIQALREGYGCYRTTPQPPEHPLNSWQKWNDAETILRDIYFLYNDRMAASPACGEIWAGQGIGVI